MIEAMDEQSHFLNVDLEIGSTRRLDALDGELGPKLFEMFRGREGGLYRSHYEFPGQRETASETIRDLISVLTKLGPAGRRCWRAARVRDFNVGIQAGAGPQSLEVAIDADVVEAVADLGARIVVTVYAPVERVLTPGRRRVARGTLTGSR